MKRNLLITLAGALLLGGCADLGFGVDYYDSDAPYVNPYWYGNGYLGNTYWDTPLWNYGPIYRPAPPRPPLINGEPGPVIPQRPQRPSPSFPGINGMTRPGNNGFPTPGQSSSSSQEIPKGEPVNNNARR